MLREAFLVVCQPVAASCFPFIPVVVAAVHVVLVLYRRRGCACSRTNWVQRDRECGGGRWGLLDASDKLLDTKDNSPEEDDDVSTMLFVKGNDLLVVKIFAHD